MTSALQLFTSESVTEGHPDKVCDRISDAILDSLLEKDPASRVAIETMVTTGLVHVAGEVTTEAYVEIPQIVREEILKIGYDSSRMGFDGASCGISVSLDSQSPDIAGGVDNALEAREGSARDERDAQGAGDQGIMFGYACDDTPDLMPAPIWLSHRLAKRLAEVRHSGLARGLRPDGKTQVTLAYEGDRPVGIDTVLVSSQHDESLGRAELTDLIESLVVAPVLEESGLDLDTSAMKLLVNPSGRFVIGGPAGDAGVTGRKIIVDTYGGMARHGGGAFSGKDPTKVDRTGAYMARYLAKNIVAAGLAERCEVQLAYAIGLAYPVSLLVDTFGTGKISEERLAAHLMENMDLRPGVIIRRFDLRRPIYEQLASGGHFGENARALPWEQTDRARHLADALR